MKASELRERNDRSLRELEEQLTDELFRLKMQHQTGQLQETHKLEAKRRDIARVKTILSEREAESADE